MQSMGTLGKRDRIPGVYRGFWKPLQAFLFLIVLLLPIAMQTGVSAQSTTDWSPPSTVFIPETGQSIDGYFLDLWRSGGGVSAYGNPITPEIEDDGHIVQYYQYARFEYWPNDPDGNYVRLGDIGEELRPPTLNRIAAVGSAHVSIANDLDRQAVAWLPIPDPTAGDASGARRYVPETRHSVQFGFRDYWESTGEAGYLGNPVTEEFVIDGVTYQTFEKGQLAWQPGSNVWMVPVGDVLAKKYKLDQTPRAQGEVPTYSEDLFVEPEPAPTLANFQGEIWVDVDLTNQYLNVYAGDTVINSTYVSTGRPGFDTPPGTFYILTKYESDTMEGVLGGEYYNVPDVPWVMYFTDMGHALHGTYWHNNFGTTMSHGCVNLPMDFAAWLYSIAPIGTRIEIHY